MNADWYVDPLGRYEGRFFDGEQWTSQVKDRGRLVIDPDWDRAPDEEPEDITDDAYASGTGRVAEVQVPGAPIVEFPGFGSPAAAAVDAVVPAANVPAAISDDGKPDFRTESPARQVAVLGTPAEPTHQVVPSVEAHPEDTHVASSSGRRWLYALGAAILIGALLIALLPRIFSSDDVADGDTDDGSVLVADADEPNGVGMPETDVDDAQGATDADQSTGDDAADRAADSGEGTSADGVSDDGASDDGAAGSNDGDDGDGQAGERAPTGDGIMVGSLEILNGTPVLRDLEIWHASTVGGRNIELGPNAGCWFGSIGQAVVQNAHCGPVATTPGAEPRFDLVPLRFEDIQDGVIQVRPITDAVVIDEVLPNGLELVGSNGPITVASFANDEAAGDDDTDRGSRGARDNDGG